MSMTIESQSDYAWAILILVAVSFVLTLDNKVGNLISGEKTRVEAIGAILYAGIKINYRLSQFDASAFEGDKTDLLKLIVSWFTDGTANSGW
eukprot:gene3030-3310_t